MLGIPVVGTIARKKHTLNNLLNTIQKVCNKDIVPSPKLVTYSETKNTFENDLKSNSQSNSKDDISDKCDYRQRTDNHSYIWIFKPYF